MWAAAVRGFAHLGTVAWCSRCGAYAFSARVAGLAFACPLRPVSVGAEVRLKRLRRRQHPLTKMELTEPERLRFSGDSPGADTADAADSIAEDFGERFGLQFPDGAPLLLRAGRLRSLPL